MGGRRVFILGLFIILVSVAFSNNLSFATQENTTSQNDFLPWWIIKTPIVIVESTHKNNDQNTRPTFGLDYDNGQKIVDAGFTINEDKFSITDNFYTPFQEQTVNIGETNTFEAKVYADKGLRVQEFLFGVPQVGDAHLAEVGVEVWFDFSGEIQQVKAVQSSDVIDEKTLVATHQKTKCQSSSAEEKCDLVKVSLTFLEPLKYKVMALKAIDFKNRYQITYLNEGVYIAGESLNPMKTAMIPSGIKGEGLINVTQISKYSPYWASDDGRMFEKNDFGSFKEINYEFQRFADNGDARTRYHSDFSELLDVEKNRATQIFDAAELVSDLPDSFGYTFKMENRMNEELQQQMSIQAQIAQEILDQNNFQARWY